MYKKRQGTVCFLRKGDKVLLALIEYSASDRKWTGIGGYVEDGETLEDAIVREVWEETYLHFDTTRLKKVAEIIYDFQLNVFFTDTYTGELKPKEPSVIGLQWFSIDTLPFDQMYEDAKVWMPKVFEGKLIRLTHNKLEEVSGFE